MHGAAISVQPFFAMEGAKSKAAHASKAAAMTTKRHGASQPVRTLPSSKAAGSVVYKPIPKSAQRLLAGGATGHVHGAPPPVVQPTILDSEHVIDDYSFSVVRLNFISYNFGIRQVMIESARRWSTQHAQNLCRVLQKFGEGSKGDIILGCELGDHGQGFAASRVDFGDTVTEALPNAKTASQGAYGVMYNPIVVLQKSGKYTPGSSMEEDVDMHWMIFELSVSDVSQLAQVPIYLIVGNFHMRIPTGKVVTRKTRRRLATACLDHLSGLGEQYGHTAAVARVLGGDFNLLVDEGRAAT